MVTFVQYSVVLFSSLSVTVQLWSHYVLGASWPSQWKVGVVVVGGIYKALAPVSVSLKLVKLCYGSA